jgi:hypothetical protein
MSTRVPAGERPLTLDEKEDLLYDKLVKRTRVLAAEPDTNGNPSLERVVVEVALPREIEDAQNSFVVQTVVCGQEQHVLFAWPAT